MNRRLHRTKERRSEMDPYRAVGTWWASRGGEQRLFCDSSECAQDFTGVSDEMNTDFQHSVAHVQPVLLTSRRRVHRSLGSTPRGIRSCSRSRMSHRNYPCADRNYWAGRNGRGCSRTDSEPRHRRRFVLVPCRDYRNPAYRRSRWRQRHTPPAGRSSRRAARSRSGRRSVGGSRNRWARSGTNSWS